MHDTCYNVLLRVLVYIELVGPSGSSCHSAKSGEKYSLIRSH